MMTCREFADFLMDYEGGSLDPEERKKFDEHMVACPPCVAYLKTYRDAIRLGKKALCGADDEIPPDAPEELVQAILASRKTR